MASRRTSYVSDDAMLDHWNDFEKWHPERPARLQRTHELHRTKGLLDRCYILNSRSATDEELELVHTKEIIEKVRASEKLSLVEVTELNHDIDPVTILSKSTNRCARLAAGCLLEVVDSVLTEKCRNGVAVIRPPGHHAGPSSISGFCVFNNIAIAAKYAIDKYNLSRVLIFDWDIHHGNGTQEIFYKDNRVLFMSLHRYSMKIFPFSKRADSPYVGEGDGKGFNVNVPWTKGEMTDADYLAAMNHLLLPIAHEFNPELVLVSAGFDAAMNDLLGDCCITPAGYSQMTSLLSTLANGKMVVALEGGYNIEMVAECFTTVTSVLLGDPCIPITSMKPSKSALHSLEKLRESLKPYWSCLSPEDTPLVIEPVDSIEKMEVHKPSCPHVSDDMKNFSKGGLRINAEKLGDCSYLCLHCFKILEGTKDEDFIKNHSKKLSHHLIMNVSNFFVYCTSCSFHVTNKVFIPVKAEVYQQLGGQL